MISRAQARALLEEYAQSRLARLAMGFEDMGGPLVILGDADHPFKHMAKLKREEDTRSAYHVAHAVHPAVAQLDATSITVCMFAYKVIQGVKYHGFLLYHVDEDEHTHTRILDPETWHHWILDDSPYWKSFPYSFAEGPSEMPAVLGRYEEPVEAPEFDEWMRR